VVINADVMHTAIQSVAETAGARTVLLTLSNLSPNIRLHTFGTLGGCTIDIQATSDSLVQFQVASRHQ
jgi:hypothetical protein